MKVKKLNLPNLGENVGQCIQSVKHKSWHPASAEKRTVAGILSFNGLVLMDYPAVFQFLKAVGHSLSSLQNLPAEHSTRRKTM